MELPLFLSCFIWNKTSTKAWYDLGDNECQEEDKQVSIG